jgi:predicted nucleic acid-binding protein
MPLLETDLVFAYLNKLDSHHEVAKNIFNKIREGTHYTISSLSLIEIELIYKSNNLEKQLAQHIAALSTLSNVTIPQISADIILTSIYLREPYNLSFFDSHYAATALQLDAEIISTDKQYQNVPGLTLIDPYNIK